MPEEILCLHKSVIRITNFFILNVIIRLNHMWLNSKHLWQIFNDLTVLIVVLLLVVLGYLIHKIWVNCTQCSYQFKHKLSDRVDLL